MSNQDWRWLYLSWGKLVSDIKAATLKSVPVQCRNRRVCAQTEPVQTPAPRDRNNLEDSLRSISSFSSFKLSSLLHFSTNPTQLTTTQLTTPSVVVPAFWAFDCSNHCHYFIHILFSFHFIWLEVPWGRWSETSLFVVCSVLLRWSVSCTVIDCVFLMHYVFDVIVDFVYRTPSKARCDILT